MALRNLILNFRALSLRITPWDFLTLPKYTLAIKQIMKKITFKGGKNKKNKKYLGWDICPPTPNTPNLKKVPTCIGLMDTSINLEDELGVIMTTLYNSRFRFQNTKVFQNMLKELYFLQIFKRIPELDSK